MRKGLLIIQLLLLIPVAFLFTFFCMDFIKRYNLTYNEMGRYFDEEYVIVYHEQAVLIYGIITAILLAFVVWLGKWTLSTLRRGK